MMMIWEIAFTADDAVVAVVVVAAAAAGTGIAVVLVFVNFAASFILRHEIIKKHIWLMAILVEKDKQ